MMNHDFGRNSINFCGLLCNFLKVWFCWIWPVLKLFSCLASRPSWMRRRRSCVGLRGSFCLWRTLSICQIRTLSPSIAHLSRRLATSTLGSKINYTHYGPVLNPRTLSIHVAFRASQCVKGCLGKNRTAEEQASSLSSFCKYVTFQYLLRE